MRNSNVVTPSGWDAKAHSHWHEGEKQVAIDAVLKLLNSHGNEKPVPLVLQLGYYIFLAGDYAGAAHFLELARQHHPQHPELLLNLAVCLSRSDQPLLALERSQEVLILQPENVAAFDTLCVSLYKLGKSAEAAAAGAKALSLKDKAQKPHPLDWSLPLVLPSNMACMAGKCSVIAFSMWGANPRYLRGAIDNALAASAVYENWTLRFYVDETVPLEVCNALSSLGGDVRFESSGQSLLQRLAWRFKVANDPEVGRFLIRDVDSVINQREALAVDEWVASDRWFHVMRDWWSHTDLILAGMWGGVAGVLPQFTEKLALYKSATMETANIDQWFLRDEVWCFVRTSCLVHDRCFSFADARPWPGLLPQGNVHVGQDVFAVQREAQETRLADWLPRLKSLQLPAPSVVIG